MACTPPALPGVRVAEALDGLSLVTLLSPHPCAGGPDVLHVLPWLAGALLPLLVGVRELFAPGAAAAAGVAGCGAETVVTAFCTASSTTAEAASNAAALAGDGSESAILLAEDRARFPSLHAEA